MNESSTCSYCRWCEHVSLNLHKKLSCCCDSRSYCLRRTAYRQTNKPVSVTSWRTAAIRTIRLNSSVTSPSQWIIERNTTSAHLIVCRKNTFAFSFDSFFSVRFVAARYILQQKCLEGQITCLLGTRWYNLWPCTPTLRATIHSVTDRRMDRRTTR